MKTYQREKAYVRFNLDRNTSVAQLPALVERLARNLLQLDPRSSVVSTPFNVLINGEGPTQTVQADVYVYRGVLPQHRKILEIMIETDKGEKVRLDIDKQRMTRDEFRHDFHTYSTDSSEEAREVAKSILLTPENDHPVVVGLPFGQTVLYCITLPEAARFFLL